MKQSREKQGMTLAELGRKIGKPTGNIKNQNESKVVNDYMGV